VRRAQPVYESVLRDFNELQCDERVGGDERLSRSSGACAAEKRTDFAWRNKTFRKGPIKSLISLMARNQPFRGIVSFQELNRRFVSLCFAVSVGGRCRRRSFQIRPNHHSRKFRKREPLLAGKNRFAGCDRLSRRDREEPPSATTSRIAASTQVRRTLARSAAGSLVISSKAFGLPMRATRFF